MLVELACATALAPGYIEQFFSNLSEFSALKKRSIVFIVDGGFKVSLKELQDYQLESEKAMKNGAPWDIFCNGEHWRIPQ